MRERWDEVFGHLAMLPRIETGAEHRAAPAALAVVVQESSPAGARPAHPVRAR